MQPSTVSICLMVSLIGLIAGDVRGGEKLGFFEAPFVHPGLIECLAGDLSDRHPSIVALDLEEAQGSNQIAGARDFAIILPEGDSTSAPWCLFKANPGGSRDGKIVFVQHREIQDPAYAGSYTIKVYKSHKLQTDSGWQQQQITLEPRLNQPEFEKLQFDPNQAEDLQVIGEFITTVK